MSPSLRFAFRVQADYNQYRAVTQNEGGMGQMKHPKAMMQIVTVLYLLLAAALLDVAAQRIPSQTLLQTMLPLALGLLALWFLLIYAILKWQNRKK